MEDLRLKQLTIKTGVVKRLSKEIILNEKEVDIQKNRIEKVKNSGGDDHVIRKQEEVLAECLMAIPDCRRRLEKAIEDLKDILDSENDLQELEQYKTAVTIVEEANAQLA